MTVQLGARLEASKRFEIHTEHPERSREVQGSHIGAIWSEPPIPCWQSSKICDEHNLWNNSQVEDLAAKLQVKSTLIQSFKAISLIRGQPVKLKINLCNPDIRRWHINVYIRKYLTSVTVGRHQKTYREENIFVNFIESAKNLSYNKEQTQMVLHGGYLNTIFSMLFTFHCLQLFCLCSLGKIVSKSARENVFRDFHHFKEPYSLNDQKLAIGRLLQCDKFTSWVKYLVGISVYHHASYSIA